MTGHPRPQAVTEPVTAWSASWWLRIGQVAMFVGLLVLATAMAVVEEGGIAFYLLSAVMLVIFLAGMWLADRLTTWMRLLWVGSLFLLTVWSMMLNDAYLWVAFPLWTLAAAVLPLIASLLVTAVTVAVIVTILTMGGSDAPGLVLGPLAGALVAVGLSRGVLQFEHEASENRRLLNEVIVAQEETAKLQRQAGVLEERTRLAHDIHDTLAQGFSSLVLLARAARRDPNQAEQLLEQIEQTASVNLAESRRVIYALDPDESGTEVLAEQLRALVAGTAEAIGAEASVTVDPDLPALPTTTEVAVLRSAQGALANVRQHSRATRVALELARSGEMLLLDIVDDGVGFDPQSVPRPSLDGGYGLRALRERLTALGGGLTVESEPGGGTAVSAHLPVVEESA